MNDYPRVLETPDPTLYLQRPRVLSSLLLHDHITEPANNAHLRQTEPWAEDYTWGDAYGDTVNVCRSMKTGGDMMQYWLMGADRQDASFHLAGRVTLYEHKGTEAYIGYHVGVTDCRRGFATTASQRIVEHARGMWGINTVLLAIAEGNVASQGVARKLGALPTECFKNSASRGQVYTRRVWRWELD